MKPTIRRSKFDIFVSKYFSGSDTPEGDFAKDWGADSLKEPVHTWSALKNYLERRGACNDAIYAAKSVWYAYELRKEWERKVRKLHRKEDAAREARRVEEGAIL